MTVPNLKEFPAKHSLDIMFTRTGRWLYGWITRKHNASGSGYHWLWGVKKEKYQHYKVEHEKSVWSKITIQYFHYSLHGLALQWIYSHRCSVQHMSFSVSLHLLCIRYMGDTDRCILDEFKDSGTTWRAAGLVKNSVKLWKQYVS